MTIHELKARPVKILVCDDDRGDIKLIRVCLSQEEQVGTYTILEATDGTAALQMARKYQPDVILMDIIMPGGDGYTACYAVKNDKSTMHIPIIMLTGLDFELNKLLAEKVGADGYITKPVHHENLVATIDRLMEGKPTGPAENE